MHLCDLGVIKAFSPHFWESASRVTALGAVVAAGAAIWVGWKAGQIATAQRDVAGMDLLRQTYDQFFHGAEMRMVRHAFVDGWQKGENNDAAASRILNLFEEIGEYVVKEFVPKDVAYDMLSMWVLHYWYASESYIADKRGSPPDLQIWEHAQTMVEDFEDREDRAQKRAKRTPLTRPYPKDELDDFFAR